MRTNLREQIRRVLVDGNWHTGLDIARAIGRDNWTTGISAKLRDLRKPQYGGHFIEHRVNPDLSRTSGRQVWEFRMRLDLATTGAAARGEAPPLAHGADGQCVLDASIVEPPMHAQRGDA